MPTLFDTYDTNPHVPEAPSGLFTPTSTATTPVQSDHNSPITCPEHSSSLVPLETSVSGFNRNFVEPDVSRPETQLHLAFRHSSWLPRRQRTLVLLKQAGENHKALERFCTCGSIAWVMKSDDTTGRHRLQCSHCRSRWCVPCAVEKARLIARNVKAFTEKRTVRFVTFTLRHTTQPLTEQMDRLARSFKELRRKPQYRRAMNGGVFFFEIKLNRDGTHWHPHLHALVEGEFIAQQMLSTDWKTVTGDSYVVDIRKVPNNGCVAGYVAKYAGKAVEARLLEYSEKFCEAVLAFRGRRLFTTFGTWTKCDLSKRPTDDVGWVAIAPLHEVITRASAGDAWAQAVIRQLKRSNADVSDLDVNPDTS